MQRNLELIRTILLECESSESGYPPDSVHEKAQNDSVYGYHCYLIVDAGLAEGADVTHCGSDSPVYLITKLTFKGHDFLDATRDQGVWDRTKTKIASTVKTATLEIVMDVAKAFIRHQLGLTS
jgi:hypothetical protein